MHARHLPQPVPLADLMEVEPITLGRMIDRLEDAGLVRRERVVGGELLGRRLARASVDEDDEVRHAPGLHRGPDVRPDGLPC